MNLATSLLPNLESGRMLRSATSLLLGIATPLLNQDIFADGEAFGGPRFCKSSFTRYACSNYVILPSALGVRADKRSLRLFSSVLGPALLAVFDPQGVEGAADDVIPHAGKVLDAAAAHENHGVLLQVVPDARNVGGHLDARRQAHPRDFPQGRVRLLGGGGVDAGTHAAFLRRPFQGGRLGFLLRTLARVAHK